MSNAEQEDGERGEELSIGGVAAEILGEDAELISLNVQGYLIRVDIDLVDDMGRDPVQRAILGLLRCGGGDRPSTVPLLTEELCIGGREGLVRNVLQALVDDGLVEKDGDLYKAGNLGETEGPCEQCDGWAIWVPLCNSFLKLFLVNVSPATLEAVASCNFRECKVRVNDFLFRPDQVNSQELWTLASDDMLPLYNWPEHTSTLVRMSGKKISRISRRKVNPREFPLVLEVEVRPRFIGEPGMFFYRPVISKNISVREYVAELGGLIQKTDPEAFVSICREADKINRSYLLAHNAEFLAPLGGAEKLMSEARRNVDLNLRGIDLAVKFNAKELREAAVDAEIGYLFSRSMLQGESAARRGYHAVIQIIGRILGDVMAETLKSIEFNKAMDSMLRMQENESKDRKRAQAQELIQKRMSELSLDLGRYDFSSHMREMKSVKSAINNPSERSQLGAAFFLLFLPIFLDVTSREGRVHLSWVRAIMHSCPDFSQTYLAVVKLRNQDKKGDSACPSEMSLQDLRSNVFLIWRALGAVHATVF